MANATDMETMRDWLSKQPHLPEKIDDILIERFLLSCRGSLERTKNVMDLFFKLRYESPDFFTNRDPRQEAVQSTLKAIDTVTLPKRTKEGYQIYLHRLNETDPDKFDFLAYSKTFFILIDTRLKLETDIPAGDIPVFDMTGFTFKHMTRLMSVLGPLRRYMQITQDTHPVRLQQIHIINTTSIVKQLMNFIKPLMNSEVKKLLHLHSSMDTFTEFVPLEILPVEYGGTGGTLAEMRETASKKIEENRDWLLTNPWISDENKRQGGPRKKSNADTSVSNGSFRALCLD
uniref:Alpha-tocopherol transfer protein-like n=1 Tax=Cacopsylla melanoneura TaxID=428564 RepID=A0A8D8Q2R0_9HEMI